MIDSAHLFYVSNNHINVVCIQYEAGDFIISDNLAVAHEASADTQLPPEQIGLRVMHRTTVKGGTPPRKSGQISEMERDEL